MRGLAYTGPVYAEDDLSENLCPWCIADGTAAQTYGASFTDVGFDVPEDVPTSVLDEIEHRTPGYLAWQQDHWMYHCADGCEFLGRIGYEQLAGLPSAAPIPRTATSPRGAPQPRPPPADKTL
jgi:uncharacterized protein CbrC (UPF0167 family)